MGIDTQARLFGNFSNLDAAHIHATPEYTLESTPESSPKATLIPKAVTIIKLVGEMDARAHWDTVYSNKAPNRVSWFRPHLEVSLDLIERATPDHSASIIDVGGGESTLVDDLLARGYRNVTVLDISSKALQVTRQRLGPAGQQVEWLVADITKGGVLPGFYDVWHDRAVFHFLTEAEQRTVYVQNVIRSVKRDGHVIVSTFGPEGPARCSGLHVLRYDAESLHDQFGTHFRLVEHSTELHKTPFGTTQQFLYCYCRVQ